MRIILLLPFLAQFVRSAASSTSSNALAAQSDDLAAALENEQELLHAEKHWLAAEVATADWSRHVAEFRSVREDLVFGLVSDASSFAVRIGLLRLWWLPGSTGCVYFDETMIDSSMKALLPRGLDICYTPAVYLRKPWYRKYSRREREAILPLMLHSCF